MKIKFSPKSLNNLPNSYSLDVGDYQDLNKYRDEVLTKLRKGNKICLQNSFVYENINTIK
jgi:hypothetical protein